MTSPARDPASAARRIIDLLRERGHVALLAGGCVRDMLLGAEPKDYDVATDAPPTRVLELFPRARKVGAKFGVVLVRVLGVDVEVATFRTDGSYSDGRRPDEVTFGTDVEDARRRDFTINGMFFDPVAGTVIDHVGGQADLADGIIRTIGEADRRFAEDHLRLLRAVRFAARLGFVIEPATMEAIRRHAHQLALISAERIWMELEMILSAPSRAAAWRLLLESGLRPFLAPSWTPAREEDDLAAIRLDCLSATLLPVHLPVAALLLHRAPATVSQIGRELRWSNQLRTDVVRLVESLPAVYLAEELELADFKILMAMSVWPDLLEVLRVDELAQKGTAGACEAATTRAAGIDPADVAPLPLLTGDDLKAMGVAPGRTFGRVLDAVYRAQLNESLSTTDEARDLARRLLAAGDS